MNRQGTKENPRGGIEWTHIFGPRTGWTANPVRGCTHGCQWEMPCGKIVQCYAKTTAEQVAQKSYPNGFEQITWHPEELTAIRNLQEPAGIFIDSMSDLFGQGVERDWIVQVIQCIRDCPQHVFFSLTKNPGRFATFDEPQCSWPCNWFVGVSAPPTIMFGKRLELEQQKVWLRRALEHLRQSPAAKRWVSLEPLSFDVWSIIDEHRRMGLEGEIDWAVIGAASDGARHYQPSLKNFDGALRALCGPTKKPVFFKGNLSRAMAMSVCGRWMEEFPQVTPA